MDDPRIKRLNDAPPDPRGRFVLHWMQHSQRAAGNPALERAVAHANALGLPTVVLFVVDPTYPDANARHFTFLIEGLGEALAACRARGLVTRVLRGSPPEVVARIAQGAALVVTDRGYLRHLRAWRAEVARTAGRLVEMVEGDAVVPVDVASDKRETAARTIRPKINRRRFDFLDLPDEVAPIRPAGDGAALGLPPGEDISDPAAYVAGLGVDMSGPAVATFRGGTAEARRRLASFVETRFSRYGAERSDIALRVTSEISPYLHLGQISPVEVVRTIRSARGNEEAREVYLEEMIVRRELAINYVEREPGYDRYDALPTWARQTLEDHAPDERSRVYTREQLEAASTHDRYWNAAMTEMKKTGYLHNYMRMYWGKQIITYMRSPREAFETALHLNNKYLLDGRDANSYASIGWLFGVHDRGWPERPVFGKVRSMTPSGLERKFDVEAYLAHVARL